MFMRFLVILWLVSWASPALAADPDQTMPTVLPWTGTQLNLDENNSYLSFSLQRHFFRGPLGPLRLGLRVTTPIEGKNRIVTSLKNPAHFNFGYNVKLTLAWDTSYWARYDLALPPVLRREICPRLRKEKGKAKCDAQAVDGWRQAPDNAATIQKWEDARVALRKLELRWDARHHRMQLRWYELRNQLVLVTAQRMTPQLQRMCLVALGRKPGKAKASSQPAKGATLGAFQRARRVLLARALLSRHCAAQLRLKLLAQERRITTLTHQYARRRADLLHQIDVYDALRALPGQLQARESQPIAAHLFPSTTMPYRSRMYWAAGFEFFLSYDSVHIYRLATSPKLEPLGQSSIQFGPTATLYFAPWFALTLRVGLEFSKEIENEARERCAIQNQNARDSTQTCEDAFFLVAHPWYTRLYARAALTSMFQFEAITLGAELRASIENIGLDRPGEGTLFDARIVLFSLARTKSIYGRFNVGLGIVHVFGPTRRQRFLPGTTAVVPFVGVGGGF